LVFSPESTTRIRKKAHNVPNLHVLFEFGYFYGHFGKKMVAMLKYGDFYLRSDLGGYVHIFGSKFFKRGAAVKVGRRTTSEFNRWIAQL
jgi:predicted nucleotide-binding protein